MIDSIQPSDRILPHLGITLNLHTLLKGGGGYLVTTNQPVRQTTQESNLTSKTLKVYRKAVYSELIYLMVYPCTYDLVVT
jgi:hypothetical protein